MTRRRRDRAGGRARTERGVDVRGRGRIGGPAAEVPAPSSEALTGVSQKSTPADPAAGTGPADGTGIAADAPTDPPSPLGPVSILVVFIGAALLGARLVARRLARAP